MQSDRTTQPHAGPDEYEAPRAVDIDDSYGPVAAAALVDNTPPQDNAGR